MRSRSWSKGLALLGLLVGAGGCGRTAEPEVGDLGPSMQQDAGCPLVGLPVIQGSGDQLSVGANADGSEVAVMLGDVLPPVPFGNLATPYPYQIRKGQTLQLGNRGCGDLTISSVDWSSMDGEFAFGLELTTPLHLAPGETIAVPIHFVPFTTGLHTATMVLSTDSPAVPKVTIQVIGRGTKLSVAIVPQQIDFGAVATGTTVTQAFAATNHSGVPIRIQIGPLKGTDPGLFTVAPPGGSFMDLYDGDTGAFVVTYSPLVPSPTQNQAYFSLKLCSSGTGCEPLVSLRGTAWP